MVDQGLLASIPQQRQVQGSTTDQLRHLITLANKFGLYDAADAVKLMIERR